MRRLALLAVTNTLLLACAVACAQTTSTAPAAAPAGGDGVVARFGEQAVTEQQLKDILGARMLQLENQVYQQKRDALEGYIADQLVEAAAKKQGVTKDEYLKAQVEDRLTEPAAEEVDKLFNQYRRQLPPDDAQAKQEVTKFLQQQQQQQLQQELRRQLFAAAGVVILLDPPRAEVKVQPWNPSQGPASAPVTLVEFTDFQCPFCGKVQATLGELTKRYDGQIRHVFKQLPLEMHKEARVAAEASLCANDQGKFWELHDWMFQNRSSLSRESIEAKATELGLDMERLRACLDGKAHAANVQSDMDEAKGVGITGTPGFLINGRVVPGAQPLEDFVRVIDDELRRAGKTPPVPAPPAS